MTDDWMRVRFRANEDDYRPVRFPPPGPYWCSGYGGDYGDGFSIVVAYVRTISDVVEFWPEASAIDILEESTAITFSERFGCPKWWTAELMRGRQ